MNSNNNEAVSSLDDLKAKALKVDRVIWLWGGLAFGIAIIACTFNNSQMVLQAGFFAKLFAVIVGTGLGLGGALIGDAIRKFAHPDAVFTSGGIFQLLWIKVFWRIGPQVIGLLLGVMLGCSMVLR